MKAFYSSMSPRCVTTLAGIGALLVATAAARAQGTPPPLAEVLKSGPDLWGEMAMRQPNGASYEFFEPLLPAPRYVNADFRYYPLVLSAPGAAVKARLISSGAGVNLRGGSRSWKDVGTPVVFRVGPDELRFGDLANRLSLPQLADGWLPIYEITYRHPFPVQSEGLVPIDQRPVRREAEVYRLEAFVSTAPQLAEHAVVFVRFSLAAGADGMVTVQLDPPSAATRSGSEIRNAADEAVALFDGTWTWERQGFHARLKPGMAATLAIPTKPLAPDTLSLDAGTYNQHRAQTIATWKEIVDRAMQVEVPETRVNNAWRNLLVQNFMLARGDRMLYSAGNQYEQLYSAEGSDAVLALMAWGYEDEARRMFVPILDFTRKGLEAHQAGFKLHDVARYWWQTRDDAWVKEMRPRWERELSRIIDHRDSQTGLLPKERYCGDISTPVHSLGVEAKAWRALRDWPPLLRAIGEDQLAEQVARSEAELQPKLHGAVTRSVRHDVTPPFIPVALLANESIHDPITATRIGSYWNLISNYIIGGRIFPPGSVEETWLPRYLETHGGLCMGMTRSGGTAHAFWTGPERVNPLYGTRYVIDALRRDDPERALVSFYGMLAQGFTRNTLIAGEGCTLEPVDAGGRMFYCPPNSAGNGHFLTILRNLLVQDFDLDGNGEPETLRFLFGTSRRWLEDGERITVDNAPTAFGRVSLRALSRLSAGEVTATLDLPARNRPQRTLLRIRLPDGWRIEAAQVGDKPLTIDEHGTVDMTGESGRVNVRFAVRRS